MPIQKVKPGDPLQISAEAYNAFVDASGRGGGRTGSDSRPGFAPDPDIVLIKNASDAAVPLCGVLGIDGVLFVPTTDAQRADLKLTWHLKGVTPVIATHAGKFAITAEPIAAGAIGRAYVSGVCPVMLDITAAGDLFADVKASSAELKTGGTGSAQIIWKESGTGAGKLGLVRLGNASFGMFPVWLTQTGGAAGSKTTGCTYTYSVFADAARTIPLGTVMTPTMQRRTSVGKFAAATTGDGCYIDGTFTLWDCDERSAKGVC